MNGPALEAHASALALVVDAWSVRAAGEVRAAVARAHAHATVALTQALISTPQGRPTLRRASRHPSTAAAIADLDALTTTLAGPSVASLSGLIRAGRAAIFTHAFMAHFASTPPEFRADLGRPMANLLRDARGLVLHGTELRREVGDRIDRAKAALAPALDLASLASMPDRARSDRIRAWELDARTGITLACRLAIGDSAVALDGLAAYHATAPEFRPTDRYSPG